MLISEYDKDILFLIKIYKKNKRRKNMCCGCYIRGRPKREEIKTLKIICCENNKIHKENKEDKE